MILFALHTKHKLGTIFKKLVILKKCINDHLCLSQSEYESEKKWTACNGHNKYSPSHYSSVGTKSRTS